MRRQRIAVSLALVGLVSGACRSAQGPAPRAGVPPPDLLQPYVGQMRVLLHQGDARSLQARNGAAAGWKGTCDVAVRIRKAVLEKQTVQLWLETLGRPVVVVKPTQGSKCDHIPHERMLTLAGFDAVTAASLAASLDPILPTPEAYLASKGVAFDLPPGPDPPVAASRETESTDEERTLARRVTAWPRNLLAVEPVYFDPAGKIRHEAEASFTGVVGADGRLHKAKVLTPLSQAHEEAILAALALWRFEPARRGDERVPARVETRTTFRIY